VLQGLSDQLEVLLGELPGRLDRLAAAGGEEDLVQVAGGVVGQAVGQLDRRRVGVGPHREEGELLGLARGRLGQLAAAVPACTTNSRPTRPR